MSNEMSKFRAYLQWKQDEQIEINQMVILVSLNLLLQIDLLALIISSES